MGTISIYIPAEYSVLERLLDDLPRGLKSSVIVECITRQYDAARIAILRYHQEQVEILETIGKAWEKQQDEMELSFQKNQRWFEELVNEKAQADRINFHGWATSPTWRKALKEHGYTPEQFVKAAKKRRKELGQ